MRIKITDNGLYKTKRIRYYAYITLWHVVLILVATILSGIARGFYVIGNFFDDGSYEVELRMPIIDWITINPEDEYND